MSDNDGVDELIEGGMRLAVTSAARVGETLARLRQQLQERSAAESEQSAREMATRIQAEMSAARTSYRGVDDPRWWDNARPEEVASMYRTAAAWRDVDPEAARVEQHMAQEVRTRYDVDVRTVDTSTLGPQMTTASEELSRRGTVDMVEATTLLAAAERADHQRSEAELAKLRDGQEAKGRSDLAQGRPATEATLGQQGRGAKARPSRGVGAEQLKQRGLSR